MLQRLERDDYIHRLIRERQVRGVALCKFTIRISRPRVCDRMGIDVETVNLPGARPPQKICSDARATGNIQNVLSLYISPREDITYLVLFKEHLCGLARDDALAGKLQLWLMRPNSRHRSFALAGRHLFLVQRELIQEISQLSCRDSQQVEQLCPFIGD